MTLASGKAQRTTTAKALERRLVEELSLTDWRAIIVAVIAKPGLEQEADRACDAAVAALGISDDRVARLVIRRDAAGREQLSGFNRARDRLLPDKRLIYLRAGSAADVRFLREVAPDLTAAFDVFVELQEPRGDEGDWEECSRQIRGLMEDRHSSLDFTGLLPGSVEQRILPLDELYQPLVDLETPSLQLSLEPTNDAPGWLVLGHPGTGKTTFVRHLAWTYATRRGDPLKIGDKVPLLISLADYGYEREQNRIGSLLSFIPKWLEEQHVEHGSSFEQNFSDVLLLLDGLDELPNAQARRGVIAEVDELLRDHQIGGVVVTGRSFLVDELPKQHGLRLSAAKEPSPEQMHAFVRSFVGLRGRGRKHADDLITKIEADPDLGALARTPLMLAFMVVLDELEGRLPERRIEIYYRLGELLVDRWTRARSLGVNAARRERPTRADALRVLGPLAWWALERGGAVTEQALLQEIERIEERREAPDEARRRAAALLELLRSDTALLVPLPGQRWSFVHQSIAEYFAGVEAERDPQRWRDLLANPFRAEWREIVLFCAGQLGVIEGRMDRLDSLIGAVLEKSRRAGRYDAKYASLITGLLAESPGISGQQTDDLVARLMHLVLRTAYSEDAVFQVQREFILLATSARGSIHESLEVAMQELLSARPSSIRWDRVFFVAHVEAPTLLHHLPNSSVRLLAAVLLGIFVKSLVEPWVSDYEIDLQPTLDHWAKQPEWIYRLAAWWVTSDPSDRDRPFSEVADQIPD